MHTACQLPMTVNHICCAHRPNLYLTEGGHDIWPKYVGVWYNKCKTLWILLVEAAQKM